MIENNLSKNCIFNIKLNRELPKLQLISLLKSKLVASFMRLQDDIDNLLPKRSKDANMDCYKIVIPQTDYKSNKKLTNEGLESNNLTKK